MLGGMMKSAGAMGKPMAGAAGAGMGMMPKPSINPTPTPQPGGGGGINTGPSWQQTLGMGGNPMPMMGGGMGGGNRIHHMGMRPSPMMGPPAPQPLATGMAGRYQGGMWDAYNKELAGGNMRPQMFGG